MATVRIGDTSHLVKSQEGGSTGKSFAEVVKIASKVFDLNISLLKKSLLEEGETESGEWKSIGMLGETREDKSFDSSERNPYARQVAQDGDGKIPISLVKDALDEMPDPSPLGLPGGILKKAMLDREVLAKRVKHLQRKGIVINTGWSHVDREVMMG